MIETIRNHIKYIGLLINIVNSFRGEGWIIYETSRNSIAVYQLDSTSYNFMEFSSTKKTGLFKLTPNQMDLYKSIGSKIPVPYQVFKYYRGQIGDVMVPSDVVRTILWLISNSKTTTININSYNSSGYYFNEVTSMTNKVAIKIASGNVLASNRLVNMLKSGKRAQGSVANSDRYIKMIESSAEIGVLVVPTSSDVELKMNASDGNIKFGEHEVSTHKVTCTLPYLQLADQSDVDLDKLIDSGQDFLVIRVKPNSTLEIEYSEGDLLTVTSQVVNVNIRVNDSK